VYAIGTCYKPYMNVINTPIMAVMTDACNNTLDWDCSQCRAIWMPSDQFKFSLPATSKIKVSAPDSCLIHVCHY